MHFASLTKQASLMAGLASLLALCTGTATGEKVLMPKLPPVSDMGDYKSQLDPGTPTDWLTPQYDRAGWRHETWQMNPGYVITFSDEAGATITQFLWFTESGPSASLKLESPGDAPDYLASVSCEFGDPDTIVPGPNGSVAGNCQFSITKIPNNGVAAPFITKDGLRIGQVEIDVSG